MAVNDGDQEAVAPAVKRVRFAMTTSSNSAVHLAIATDADQVEAETLEFFSPKFTYHAFGTDETIEGYDGLHINVYFNAYDFQAFLDVKYKDKGAGADDIIAKISSSLPPFYTQDKTEFVAHLRAQQQAEFAPPGELLDSYTRSIDGKNRHFEIYECKLENNDTAQKLQANMQTMSLWFIEGADAIDVTDSRWVVYPIYERSDAGSGSFTPVGFITLFKFFNPVGRSPPQNETHRICQALIFPPYQRQGHCERLVQCITSQAVTNEKVYELTVEDPVPAFAKLRDLVDVKNCVKHKYFSLPPDFVAEESIPQAHGTASLQAVDIHAVQKELKITHRQVQTCYEVLKLRFVDKTDEVQYKKYRLEVKKRLFKLHAEELEGMGSAERRKAFLEVEFQALEAHYTQLLKKIQE